VLRALHGVPGPRTHGEVCDSVAEDGLDRATVYRNLMALADAGIVTRTDLGDHVWRFELIPDGGGSAPRHPHYVCVDCGEVSCLPEMPVTFSTAAAAGAPGRVAEVLLRGVCDKCDDATDGA
jgi:Fur family ferric uptake transcriptional regulator